MRKAFGVVILAVALTAAACSSGNARPATAAGSHSAEATTPASQHDPLVGTWRQVFTCAAMVRLVSHAHTSNYREWAAALPDLWGAPHQSPSGPLCAHAPRRLVRTARFLDGRGVLFDPPHGQPGLDAAYRIIGANVFTLNDGGENIPGTYRFHFTVSGGNILVRPIGAGGRDAFFLAAWAVAPFHRTGT